MESSCPDIPEFKFRRKSGHESWPAYAEKEREARTAHHLRYQWYAIPEGTGWPWQDPQSWKDNEALFTVDVLEWYTPCECPITVEFRLGTKPG